MRGRLLRAEGRRCEDGADEQEKRAERRARKHELGRSCALVEGRGRLHTGGRGGAMWKFTHNLLDLVAWIVGFLASKRNAK